jgi:hypothetical protein
MERRTSFSGDGRQLQVKPGGKIKEQGVKRSLASRSLGA